MKLAVMEQVTALCLTPAEVCTVSTGGCSLIVAGANSWCQVRAIVIYLTDTSEKIQIL